MAAPRRPLPSRATRRGRVRQPLPRRGRPPPGAAALLLAACGGARAAGGTSAAAPVHVRDAAELAAALGGADGPVTVALGPGAYELPGTLRRRDGTVLLAAPGGGGEPVLRLAPSAPHPVVAIHGASGVSLRGLRVLGHGAPAARQRHMAVDIAHGRGVTLEGVAVVGGVGVRGGFGHLLSRVDVSNPFGHGHGGCVYFTSAGDPLTLTHSGHEISNSEIHDCRGLGDPWPSSAHPPHGRNPDPYPNITGNGVLINQVVGAAVRKNYIHDVNYHGVYIQSRLHSWFHHPGSAESPTALVTIELNHITNWNQCVSDPVCRTEGYLGADGGCVYFFTNLWGRGNRVLNNFCHQTSAELWHGKGLYLDGTSSGAELVSGNVLWNVTGNIIDNNNGHDNHYFGNIAIGGVNMGAMTDSNFWTKVRGPYDAANFGAGCRNAAMPASFNMTRKIMAYAGSPAWRRRFPEMLRWLNRTSWEGRSCDPRGQGTDCCMLPTGTVVNYSVMVSAAGARYHEIPPTFCGNTRAFDPPVGCWPDAAGFQRLGQQRRYTEDPGFVDMAGGNFALRRDARLFRDLPGFPEIPFWDIGPAAAAGPARRAAPEPPPWAVVV